MRAKFMRPGEHGDVIRRQHEQIGVSGALNLVAEMGSSATLRAASWRGESIHRMSGRKNVILLIGLSGV